MSTPLNQAITVKVDRSGTEPVINQVWQQPFEQNFSIVQAAETDKPTDAAAVESNISNSAGWLGWLFVPLIAGLIWWLARKTQSKADSATEESSSSPTATLPETDGASGSAESLNQPAAIAEATAFNENTAFNETVALNEATAFNENTALKTVARQATNSRIVLAVRDDRNAYAYWETSGIHRAELQEQGGQQLLLRVADVTGIDISREAPLHVNQYLCHETDQDFQVPIPDADRDYIAEIGYLTADNRWLQLAQSAPVRVSTGAREDAREEARAITSPPVSPASAETLLERSTVVNDSRIVLVPRAATTAYAYWEVPEPNKIALQQQGGHKFQLRLYGMDAAEPQLVQLYDLEGLSQDKHVSISMDDRQYVAEVGYETEDGRWLRLARSAPV